MKLASCSILLTLALCSGCATVQRPVPLESRSKTFSAPRERVFGACLLALTDRGYAIQTADAASGVVVTDWRPLTWNAGEFSCPARVRYNAIVLNDGAAQRVALTMFFERATNVPYAAWEPRGLPERMVVASYAQVFEAIDSALDR